MRGFALLFALVGLGLPTGSVVSRLNFCHSLGFFSLSEDFNVWRSQRLTLDLSGTRLELISTRRLLVDAFVGLEQGIKTAADLYEGMGPDTPLHGNWPVNWRDLYVTVNTTPVGAVTKCAVIGCRLPAIREHQDISFLAELLKFRSLSYQYLDGVKTEVGLYDRTSGYRLISKIPTKFANYNEKLGTFIFDISPHHTGKGPFGVDFDAANDQKYREVLCRCGKHRMALSRPDNRIVYFALKDTKQAVENLRDYVDFILDKIGEEVSSPSIPSDVIIPKAHSFFELEQFHSDLLEFKSNYFYTSNEVPAILITSGFISRANSYLRRRKFDDRSRRNTFFVTLPGAVQTRLHKRGLLGVLLLGTIEIIKKLASYVVDAIVRFIDREAPTLVFHIRSFLDDAGKRLKSRFLVQRQKRSFAFTSSQQIAAQNCEDVEGLKVCAPIEMGTQVDASVGCAGFITGVSSENTCEMEDPDQPVSFIENVNCKHLHSHNERENVEEDTSLLISDRKTKVDAKCPNGDFKLDVKIGQTAINTSDYTGCTFKYDNKVIGVLPRNEGIKVHPLGSLFAGFVTHEKEVDSFFGKLNKYSVEIIIFSLSTLAVCFLLLCCVCGIACIRVAMMKIFCCCCYRTGCTSWKKMFCAPDCIAASTASLPVRYTKEPSAPAERKPMLPPSAPGTSFAPRSTASRIDLFPIRGKSRPCDPGQLERLARQT